MSFVIATSLHFFIWRAMIRITLFALLLLCMGADVFASNLRKDVVICSNKAEPSLSDIVINMVPHELLPTAKFMSEESRNEILAALDKYKFGDSSVRSIFASLTSFSLPLQSFISDGHFTISYAKANYYYTFNDVHFVYRRNFFVEHLCGYSLIGDNFRSWCSCAGALPNVGSQFNDQFCVQSSICSDKSVAEGQCTFSMNPFTDGCVLINLHDDGVKLGHESELEALVRHSVQYSIVVPTLYDTWIALIGPVSPASRRSYFAQVQSVLNSELFMQVESVSAKVLQSIPSYPVYFLLGYWLVSNAKDLTDNSTMQVAMQGLYGLSLAFIVLAYVLYSASKRVMGRYGGPLAELAHLPLSFSLLSMTLVNPQILRVYFYAVLAFWRTGSPFGVWWLGKAYFLVCIFLCIGFCKYFHLFQPDSASWHFMHYSIKLCALLLLGHSSSCVTLNVLFVLCGCIEDHLSHTLWMMYLTASAAVTKPSYKYLAQKRMTLAETEELSKSTTAQALADLRQHLAENPTIANRLMDTLRESGKRDEAQLTSRFLEGDYPGVPYTVQKEGEEEEKKGWDFMTTVAGGDQLLIDGIKSNDFAMFQRGLDCGGNVDVMATEADPALDYAHPYPLLIYVLARKEFNKDIYAALIKKNPNVTAGSIKNFTPLMAAAHYHHNEIFDELLARGADVHSVHSGLNVNVCYFAAMGGNMSILNRCVAEYRQDPLQVSLFGKTTAIVAIMSKHIEVAKYLIEHYGVDPNKPDNEGFTPFMAACRVGTIEMVQYLFEVCKVDPTKVQLDGSSSALYTAAVNGHLEVVKYLLEVCKVGNINQKYFNGYTAVNVAANKGHLEIVKLLCTQGKADFSVTTDQKSNSFTEAARWGHLDVVRYICEEVGTLVELNCKVHEKYLALNLSRLNKHISVVQYLTENICQWVVEENLTKVVETLAADPNLNISVPLPVRKVANGEYGAFECRLPLDIAIEGQSQTIIDALWPRVDFSANVDYNKRYLLSAVIAADFGTVKRLLAEESMSALEISLLWQAAKSGSAEIFMFLREAHHLQIEVTGEKTVEDWMVAAATGGSLVIFEQVTAAVNGDLHMRLDSGESLLHLACRAGSVELAAHFISNKLDLNDDQNRFKESPICDAVRSGSLPLVKHMIAAGANASIVLSEHSSTFPGASLLHLAADSNSHEILAWLLSDDCETHFDPELRDGAGWTPIHRAARAGEVDCIRVLCNSGADVNASVAVKKDVSRRGGNTPLMIASFLAAEESVSFLLQHGAEVNHQCGQGHSELYYAIPQPNQHIYPEDCFTTERYERTMRIIKLLLAKEELQPNLRVNDTRFDTRPLDQALWLQHVGIAQILIEDPRVNVNGRCCKSGSPFAHCVEDNLEEITKLLLKRSDLEVNEQNLSGESPLVIAQRRERIDLIPLIKAHPNFQGENPVFAYVRENKLVEVRACLERDADLIELTHDNGETLLFIACSYCLVDMIKLIMSFWQERVQHWLVNGEYDVIHEKITDRWHVSFGSAVHQVAMMLAQIEAAFEATAEQGSDAVDGLLEHLLATFSQVFPEREEHFKLVCMQFASLAYISLIKAEQATDLVKYHQHLQNTLEMLYFNEKNASGTLPLWMVAVDGLNVKCVECVEYMLSQDNVLVNLETPSGDSPVLLWIPERTNTAWVKIMLKLFLDCLRVDVNKHSRRKGWDGHSPLTRALTNATSLEHALTIASARPEVDVNYRIGDGFGGQSAMAYAADANCVDLIKLMLTFPSVNVNVVDAKGLTPLIHAAFSCRALVVEMLVADLRVDVNMVISERYNEIYPVGSTALHFAAYGNSVRCMELLYQRPELNREPITTVEKWTPLMFAALKGFANSVKWLVMNGADVFAVDKDGMTARLLALQCGRIRIAGILLEREQELERIANQKQQDDLTVKINAVDAQQNEQRNAHAALLKSHSMQIRELQTIVVQHTEQLCVLNNFREVMMSERLILQQMAEAVKYIKDRPMLKAFYNHLQSKLTELFLAYKTLASGAVSRAETTTDMMVGYAINLAGSMIPLVGDVATMAAEIAYGTVRDSREDAIFSFVSSLVVNVEEMSQLVKAAARLTVYKIESQLERLDGTSEAESLAECVVGYYLAGLRGKAFEVSDDTSVFKQLSFCLFKYEPAGMFSFLNETVLKTHSSHGLPKWTARGSLKESGIMTFEGVCLAHPKASVHVYGYRFGSTEEAQELGYTESTIRLDPAHPLRENPFRHKEVVEMPEMQPVLTWAVLLNNAKDISDFAMCINCLDTCDSEGPDVEITFKLEVTRSQLLQLAGYLSKQSKQVVDCSIGPVTACTAVKGTSKVVLRTDNDISAELLSIVILEQWRT